MTNEEAINVLSTHREHWERLLEDGICDKREGAEFIEACEMAIKALEQEDVLEKIRAEIENHCGLLKKNHCRYCSYCNCVMGVREILEVIDKYRAESEDAE